MNDSEKLKAIRQIAYAVHCYFGVGFLEKVYENAFAHRLQKAGFDVKTQVPIVVKDEDGFVVGNYEADIVVDNQVIIELKAVQALTNVHKAQLLNYLKATGYKQGLLINFGSAIFQIKSFLY